MKLSYRTDEERRSHCRETGILPEQHCCLDMAWFISKPIEWPSQGANAPLLWISSFDEYLVNIPMGGNTAVPIRFCPWCGTRLPESKQELWRQTLRELGYRDPGNEKIPPEFNTDRWWRDRSP